jgi:SAM-dependent methyltransferase
MEERLVEEIQVSPIDLLIETHVGLERQGPGSHETTVRALGFLGDLDKISRVADLGCGTGGQTMILAQHIKGTITGVDLSADFIDVFNGNAKKSSLHDRVNGIVGSMDDLHFQQEAFDLVWSEGAIDNIGFEKGLRYWNGFLKEGGYIAVTSPTWFTADHPAEVDRFWCEAGSKLDTVEYNILLLQNAGYKFLAAFALPEECWTDNYFVPRGAVEKLLCRKYAGNEVVRQYVEDSRREVELYSKYRQHYGYTFYIAQKHEYA